MTFIQKQNKSIRKRKNIKPFCHNHSSLLLLRQNSLTNIAYSRKGFIWIILPDCSSPLREDRARTQAGAEVVGWLTLLPMCNFLSNTAQTRNAATSGLGPAPSANNP